MKLDIRRGDCYWAATIRTASGWWGISHVGVDTWLDLGNVRVGRAGGWVPLYAEPKRIGPLQWWRC